MDGFLSWFFAFMTTMLGGIWQIISNLFLGLLAIFNFPVYFDQFSRYKSDFNILAWILAIFCFILVFAVWGALIFLAVLGIRKYFRFRKTLVGNEDLLEEIADLHHDVIKLTEEKERIMALKIANTGLSIDELRAIFDEEDEEEEEAAAEVDGRRFFRLSAVDEKYDTYTPPTYQTGMSLDQKI